MLYVAPCRINEHLPPYVFAGCSYVIPLMLFDGKRNVLCSSERPKAPQGLPVSEALSNINVIIKGQNGADSAVRWEFVDTSCKIKGIRIHFPNRSLSQSCTIAIQGSPSLASAGNIVNVMGSYFDGSGEVDQPRTRNGSGFQNANFTSSLSDNSAVSVLHAKQSSHGPGRPPKSRTLNKVSVNLNVLLPVEVTPLKYMLRVTEKNSKGGIMLADNCEQEDASGQRDALGLCYNNVTWYKDEKGKENNFIDCSFEIVDREDRVQSDFNRGTEANLKVSLCYCKEENVIAGKAEGCSKWRNSVTEYATASQREEYLCEGESSGIAMRLAILGRLQIFILGPTLRRGFVRSCCSLLLLLLLLSFVCVLG